MSILFLIEANEEKMKEFSILGQDPDPIFPNSDPRLQIKMIRIHNTTRIYTKNVVACILYKPFGLGGGGPLWFDHYYTIFLYVPSFNVH